MSLRGLAGKKATTAKGKRILKSREPKLIEDVKNSVCIRGGNTSERIRLCMQDIYQLNKATSSLLNRKNPMIPFEDVTSLEFLSQRNDASMFLFGSHNKKRPDNLIFGRTYDAQLLDMIEVGVSDYKAMSEFKIGKCAVGSKPAIVFNGDMFDGKEEYVKLRSLLLDFFRGRVVSAVNLTGVEHVISFSANSADGKVIMRVFKIVLKKSGSETPRVELDECGPRIDMVIRRSRFADADLQREAMKQPASIRPRIKKNIERDSMGAKRGRIHMGKQNIEAMQTRKVKALKANRKNSQKADVNDDVDNAMSE